MPSKNSYLNSPKSLPLTVISLLLFINCFFVAYNIGVASANIDFFTWWAVPHGMAKKYIKNPYAQDEQKLLAQRIIEERNIQGTPHVEDRTLDDILELYDNSIIATASPLLFTFINLFAADDYQMAKRKFIMISLLCLTAAFLLLGRMLDFNYPNLFLFYSLIVTSFSPFLVESKVGNINSVQLLLITLFIFLTIRGKGFNGCFWAAFFLSISILLKPNTSLILIYALAFAFLNKDIKKIGAYCAGFAFSVITALAATSLYFKNDNLTIWKEWLQTIPTTASGIAFTLKAGNYSLNKIIWNLCGINMSLYIYMMLLGLFLWTCYCFQKSQQKSSLKIGSAIKKERELKGVLLVIGFGVVSLLIGSGLVWMHYYVLTIPLYLFFLRSYHEQAVQPHSLTKPLTYTALGLSTQVVMRQLPIIYSAVNSILIAVILLLLIILETQKDK